MLIVERVLIVGMALVVERALVAGVTLIVERVLIVGMMMLLPSSLSHRFPPCHPFLPSAQGYEFWKARIGACHPGFLSPLT